jgi:hypothetical protein
VVPAAVASAVFDHRLAFRGGGLRQARQRVELADDPDDRISGAIARDEGGGDFSHTRLHVEAGGFQLLLQQRAAPGFLIPHLGEIPDLLRHVAIGAALRIDRCEDGGGVGLGGGGDCAREENQRNCDE